MPREWLDRLQDILEAMARIREFTAGMDLCTFRADPRTVGAVAYHILVIGECVAHLPASLTDRHPEVPWHRIRGMRNVLAHAYYETDPTLLWAMATTSLPELEQVIQVLFEEQHGRER